MVFFFGLTFFINEIACQFSVISRSSYVEKQVQSVTKQLESATKTIKLLEKENSQQRAKLDSCSEYCKLLPDNVCGPCQYKDDDRLFERYYCDCQNLKAKRDCLEFCQCGVKVNDIYQVHQNLLKIIQV